jgi:hypothetical protein
MYPEDRLDESTKVYIGPGHLYPNRVIRRGHTAWRGKE